MVAGMITTIVVFAVVAALSAAAGMLEGRGFFDRRKGRHADKVKVADNGQDNGRDKNRADSAYPQLAGPAQADSAPDTLAEIASMGRLRGTAGQRAGYWPMGDAQEPGGLIIRPGRDLTEEEMEAFRARFESVSRHRTTIMPDPPAVQALVYDDPVRGHEYDAELDVRHHDPQPPSVAQPYCSRCGRHGHWTGEECPAAAAAIAGHLRAAGLKVYASEDDALESMWTKAMGRAVAAIEGATDG